MSGAWAPKRFWKEASVAQADGGFQVLLDGRHVKTPAKAPLILPSKGMAQAVAAEWDAQDGLVRPETMPVTRMANSAIDKVAPLFAAVVDEVAGFGGTDLLCYRATEPAALIARQADGWDPLLDWAAQTLGAPLNTTAGIIPVAQPPASLAALRAHVAGLDAFRLAALHDLVAITGSLVLGLAVAKGRLRGDAAFALSRIDELWQIEQWGADEESQVAEAHRREGLLAAERFYGLCG